VRSTASLKVESQLSSIQKTRIVRTQARSVDPEMAIALPKRLGLKRKRFPFLKRAKFFGFSDLDMGMRRRTLEVGNWRLEAVRLCGGRLIGATDGAFWNLANGGSEPGILA